MSHYNRRYKGYGQQYYVETNRPKRGRYHQYDDVDDDHYDSYPNLHEYYDDKRRRYQQLQQQQQQRQHGQIYPHSAQQSQPQFQYRQKSAAFSQNHHEQKQHEHEYENDPQFEQDSYVEDSEQATNYYVEERSRYKTRNIRDMNNWCKYVNITHSIREQYKENAEQRINILDLGCGKANDLLKYRGNKKYIHKLLGIDISLDCIILARKKYERILQENIKHRNASYAERKKFGLNNAYGQTAKEFYDGPIFDAQFICQDMNNENLANHQLILQKRPFHLVNVQFALHYGFQTMTALKGLLNTIKSATTKGSYFICSFVRDDLIINRLTESSNQNKISDDNYIVFENDFQFIKMKKSVFKFMKSIYERHDLLNFDAQRMYEDNAKIQTLMDSDSDLCHGLIGIPYQYYQLDSVEGDDDDDDDGVEEYFISFAVLCKLLFKHCKMKLIYKKTASDIYIESSRKFPFRYGYSKGRELDTVKWTNDEQQVIDTYGYALFQRS